jgi:hypothetical protein
MLLERLNRVHASPSPGGHSKRVALRSHTVDYLYLSMRPRRGW